MNTDANKHVCFSSHLVIRCALGCSLCSIENQRVNEIFTAPHIPPVVAVRAQIPAGTQTDHRHEATTVFSAL